MGSRRGRVLRRVVTLCSIGAAGGGVGGGMVTLLVSKSVAVGILAAGFGVGVAVAGGLGNWRGWPRGLRLVALPYARSNPLFFLFLFFRS